MGLTRRQLIASLAGIPVVARTPIAPAADDIRLRLAHPYPDSWPIHHSLLNAIEALRDQTEWLVNIEVFPAGQLGPSSELIEQIYKGPVHFAVVLASTLSTVVAELEVLELPTLFRDFSHWNRFAGSEAESVIAERIRTQGLELIGSTWIGSNHFITRSPVQTPYDLHGMRLRLPRLTFAARAGYEELGITPVQIPFSEVHAALKAGVVDGAVGLMPWSADVGILEVSNAIQQVPVGGATAWLITSEELKSEMGDYAYEATRTALRQALMDAAETSNRLTEAVFEGAADKGISVATFDSEIWEQFRSRMYGRMIGELTSEGEKIAALLRDQE